MDRTALGKKIKEARLAKKLTQSEVVGSFITRNMLSQIESGTAMPSVKTLAYLSEVLDLPMEQLVGSGPESDLDQLIEAKDLLRRGKYAQALARCEEFSEKLSDEFHALRARAYLGQARVLAAQDALADVTSLVHKAIECAGQGLYANQTLRTEAILFLNQQAERLSQYYLGLSANSKKGDQSN